MKVINQLNTLPKLLWDNIQGLLALNIMLIAVGLFLVPPKGSFISVNVHDLGIVEKVEYENHAMLDIGFKVQLDSGIDIYHTDSTFIKPLLNVGEMVTVKIVEHYRRREWFVCVEQACKSAGWRAGLFGMPTDESEPGVKALKAFHKALVDEKDLILPNLDYSDVALEE